MKKIALSLMALAVGISAHAIGKKYDSNTYEALPTSVSTNAYEFGVSYYRNNTVAFFRTDTSANEINDKKLSKSGIKIYTAKITADGNLENAEIAQDLIDLGVSGAFAYDAKNDKIYFSKYNKTNKVYQLFESYYEGEAWGAAQLVEIKKLTPNRKNMSVIENASWDYLVKGASILQPSLAKDGSRIYFSSNLKKGSEGKFDIWYIDYDEENDIWSEPVNAGKGLNTAGNEQYPSVVGDSILYYTTNAEGAGAYDVQVARIAEKDTLETENLGDLFNTSANEYNLITDNKTIYFVADRGSSKDDIMYLKLKLLPLPEIALPEDKVAEEPVLQIKTFPWKFFYFDFDKDILSAEASNDLDLLYNTMLDYIQDNEFTVWGHTDERGSDAYNQKLSERRAKAIAKELEKRGIPKAKLHVQGFGESNPAVPNAETEEQHAQNRRVIVDVVRNKE
ncbi:MAG: OmpA family protein [Prevotellaceae bacterium]|jgi:outer membrane protein OmpA-like peptidoglycan-associated protein|nr:OmpA family protein [Prevotellaceae bacterium]